jgi:photosystem II stability/assembly factor-like uncharacterized protein
MNKNLIALLSIVTVLFYGCSKSNQPGPKGGGTTASVKIEVVSGDKQTDTIGRPLANPITVKVTLSGAALAGYQVQFLASGCNSDRVDKYPTGADGTASYNWSLAGDIGPQTLKMIVFDSQNQKIDSVTATSTALAPLAGWHFSACTPFAASTLNFCKLSTGRLFINFEGKNYLRYSDDNGASWNAVKSLGLHEFQDVISTPADELYAFTISEATFHSTDGGQTWTALAVPPFNVDQISSAEYSPSGKLLVATQHNSVFISSDKGQTWLSVPLNQFTAPNSTGPDGDFATFTEDKAGNLYVVGDEGGTIYTSANAGVAWSAIVPPIVPPSQEAVLGLYIDNNNWFYKSRFDYSGGIYLSKDGGATYSLLYSASDNFIGNISVQTDGNLYFSMNGALYKANGISNSVKKIFDYQQNGFVPYIVAKNGSAIAANSFATYYYTN